MYVTTLLYDRTDSILATIYSAASIKTLSLFQQHKDTMNCSVSVCRCNIASSLVSKAVIRLKVCSQASGPWGPNAHYTPEKKSCQRDEQKRDDTVAQRLVLLPHSNKVVDMNPHFCKGTCRSSSFLPQYRHEICVHLYLLALRQTSDLSMVHPTHRPAWTGSRLPQPWGGYADWKNWIETLNMKKCK